MVVGKTGPGRKVLETIVEAAVNIASDLGARVIATTRRKDRAGLLRSLGAESVVIESGSIAGAVRELAPGGADRVLDLVGNSALRDSLQAAGVKGRVCQAGFLGGLGPVADFLPAFDMPSGVQFSFFGSFEVNRGLPDLSDPVPEHRRQDRGGHLPGQARPGLRLRRDRRRAPGYGGWRGRRQAGRCGSLAGASRTASRGRVSQRAPTASPGTPSGRVSGLLHGMVSFSIGDA